jgi:hypothetical protein
LVQSEIPSDLIAAYRATGYRITTEAGFGSGEIVLRIDEYSAPLSRLFTASDHRCAAFITACNPLSVRQSHADNLAACARLRDRLERLAQAGPILAGKGCDPSGAWPVEESYCVLGLDLETSQALGREFGQNAIVWTGPDAIPRLILLR